MPNPTKPTEAPKPRPLTRVEMVNLINSTIRGGGWVRWHQEDEKRGHEFYAVEAAWSRPGRFRVKTIAGWKTTHWHSWFDINGTVWRNGMVDQTATAYFRDLAAKGAAGLYVPGIIDQTPRSITGL